LNDHELFFQALFIFFFSIFLNIRGQFNLALLLLEDLLLLTIAWQNGCF